MELVKKIIATIFILLAVALAGVIICCGVLIVSPKTTIFGVSYLNTSANSEQQFLFEKIENVNSVEDGTYTIEVNAKDFTIEIVENTDSKFFQISYIHNVIGFTRETHKTVDFEVSYSDGTIGIDISDPEGFFVKSNRVLKIALPAHFHKNNNINVVSRTRNGDTVIGTQDNKVTVNNIDCACSGTKGGVELENAIINGSLKIDNILGRVIVKNEVKGDVVIDSTIGTYEFGKINNLTVLASSVEGRKNAPSITMDECNDIKYYAESGYLVVKNYVLGEIEIDTHSANVEIGKALQDVLIESYSSTIKIDQLGNFETDSTTKYNSWNWKITDTNSDEYSENETKKNRAKTIKSDSGNITIGKSYFNLDLESKKGKIVVTDAMKGVNCKTESGVVNVTFNYGDELSSTSQLNNFINNSFITYLDTDLQEPSLQITAKNAIIKAYNIRNKVSISSDSSPIDLVFKKVKGYSTVSTSSKAVNIKSPTADYIIIAKMNKTSGASLTINYSALVMNSYYDEINDSRMVKTTEGNYKCLTVNINNATNNCTDKIEIINTTGKISATSI